MTDSAILWFNIENHIILSIKVCSALATDVGLWIWFPFLQIDLLCCSLLLLLGSCDHLILLQNVMLLINNSLFNCGLLSGGLCSIWLSILFFDYLNTLT